VRLKMQMGVFVGRVVPELVDKQEAAEEIKELSYIAQPLKLKSFPRSDALEAC
jgi:hypothetical protein